MATPPGQEYSWNTSSPSPRRHYIIITSLFITSSLHVCHCLLHHLLPLSSDLCNLLMQCLIHYFTSQPSPPPPHLRSHSSGLISSITCEPMQLFTTYVHVHVNERLEGRKKQGRSNKQQSKVTQHTQGSNFSYEKLAASGGT